MFVIFLLEPGMARVPSHKYFSLVRFEWHPGVNSRLQEITIQSVFSSR